MQRNIGNEVIVAIVAVSVLAFALTFGIIISLSNSNSGMVAQSNVATEDLSATTEEAALTEEASPTDEPTVTEESTATDEPTATDSPTSINEPTETIEPTVTRAPTETDEPTVTDEPTTTLTHTRTPRPTATDEPTEIPSATPSSTATATDRPTLTPTNTPQPTATRTPTLTRTRTATPTLTSSPTMRPSPTPTVVCIAPFGWGVYEVRQGDTLDSIAQMTGSTLDALREANCLVSINQVQPGDRLYIPSVAAEIRSMDGFEAQGCTDARSFISSPVPGARVNNSFILVGTATLDNFANYQIEIRRDDANAFTLYSRSNMRVVDGVLGFIELRNYGKGLHWVRLSVVDTNGMVNVRTCAIPVIFE